MSTLSMIGVELCESSLNAVVVENDQLQGRYWQNFSQPLSLQQSSIKLAALQAYLHKLRNQIPRQYKQIALVVPDYFVTQKTFDANMIAEPIDSYGVDHVQQQLLQYNLPIDEMAMDFCVEQNHERHDQQVVRVVTMPKRIQKTLLNQCQKAGFEARFITIHSHALMAANEWACNDKPWFNLHLSSLQWSVVQASLSFSQHWCSEQLRLSSPQSCYQFERSFVVDSLNQILKQIELAISQFGSEQYQGVWLSCDFDSEQELLSLVESNLNLALLPTHVLHSALTSDVAPITGERIMLLATGAAIAAINWSQQHVLA